VYITSEKFNNFRKLYEEKAENDIYILVRHSHSKTTWRCRYIYIYTIKKIPDIIKAIGCTRNLRLAQYPFAEDLVPLRDSGDDSS